MKPKVAGTSERTATKTLSDKVETLHKKAITHFEAKEIDSALDIANQVLELLIQCTDEAHFLTLARNYLLLGNIYFTKSNFNQVLNYAERILKIGEKFDLGIYEVKAYLLLGKTYLEQQEYVAAIRHLLEVKSQSKEKEQFTLFAQSLLYIGIVYNNVFHYPKALENHLLLKEAHFSSLIKREQILLLNYLGKSFLLSNKDEQAEQHFEAAINLAHHHKNKEDLVFSFAYVGRIYARKKALKKALIHTKRANNLAEERGDVDGIQVNLINLGDIHCQLEKYNEGIKLTSRGIAAAKRKKDSLSEIRGYQIMAEIFRKKKDYKSAVMYQLIYTKFYEDFYHKNDRQMVLEVEHQFTINELEHKIKLLQAQKK